MENNIPEEDFQMHADLLERYKRQHLKVITCYSSDRPTNITGFLVKGDGWEERIGTISGLYGWLNGYTRARSIIE